MIFYKTASDACHRSGLTKIIGGHSAVIFLGNLYLLDSTEES